MSGFYAKIYEDSPTDPRRKFVKRNKCPDCQAHLVSIAVFLFSLIPGSALDTWQSPADLGRSQLIPLKPANA